MSPVSAPAAPGKLGTPVDPQAMLAYLGALDAWVAGRRSELGALDAEILNNPARASLTSDMALSLALWQAVKNRHDLLLVTWDSGRVGPAEAERLSSLIWGRLDTSADAAALSGMNVSLPEACRLSDALVAQLRTALHLDPQGEQQATRLRDLRAQVERIRDQLRTEPPPDPQAAAGQLSHFVTRVDDLTSRRERGADIGGLLGPLEIDAARYERDLIVGAARRRENRDLLARAHDILAELTSREESMRKLVAKAVAEVYPAPKYAVPDVAALGPLPNTKDALVKQLEKFDQVGRAMQVVQDAYGQALAEKGHLSASLDALIVRAEALGQADNAELAAMVTLGRTLLAQTPSPTAAVTQLLAAARAHLDFLVDQAGDAR